MFLGAILVMYLAKKSISLLMKSLMRYLIPNWANTEIDIFTTQHQNAVTALAIQNHTKTMDNHIL